MLQPEDVDFLANEIAEDFVYNSIKITLITVQL